MSTNESANQSKAAKRHQGGCHCGAVRFEVDVDASNGTQCNCTICTKTAFKLLTDESALSMYEWGMKVGKRYFCKTCGIHCFGRGHLDVLGGDYVSINLSTLDDFDPLHTNLMHWDGRHNNWQAGPRPTRWPINPS